MPWVDENRCTACGECVEECPSGAISMQENKADIDMEGCIRCGLCHDICPEEAVRHDGELVPDNVEANIEKVKSCMEACAKHFGDAQEGEKCLNRFMKHFTNERGTAEKTLERLESLKKGP